MKKIILLCLCLFICVISAQVFNPSGIDSTLFVKNIDSTLYIAAKFNSTNDIIYTFDKCMANDLYTFKNVALYENSADSINEDVTRPYTTMVISSTITDNIGPVGIIYGKGLWMGGNHLFTDSLGIKYKTAFTKDIKISVNDSIYAGNFELNTNHVTITVQNDLYYPEDLPVHNVCINETAEYRITASGIEIYLTHDILRDLFIVVYYGMQSVGAAWQEKIFMPNSQYSYELDKADSIYSGAISDYPDVYRTVLYNSSKTICQDMSLVCGEGLFANTDQFINPISFFSRVFTLGGKTFFTQIRNKSVLSGDSYYWKGKYRWYDGTETGIDHEISDDSAIVNSPTLYQNYPNPFNPVTKIKYDLAKTSNIRICVYNIIGQLVLELENCVKEAGFHSIDVNGNDLNSGIYYYTLEVDGVTMTKKMLLIK